MTKCGYCTIRVATADEIQAVLPNLDGQLEKNFLFFQSILLSTSITAFILNVFPFIMSDHPILSRAKMAPQLKLPWTAKMAPRCILALSKMAPRCILAMSKWPLGAFSLCPNQLELRGHFGSGQYRMIKRYVHFEKR